MGFCTFGLHQMIWMSHFRPLFIFNFFSILKQILILKIQTDKYYINNS